MFKLRLSSLLLAAFAALASLSSTAAQKDHFSVCWTIYAGWMPWEYAGSQGIVDKWAKKYGIKIDVVQLNDYVESINQYTAGQFDGCTMTNMDALTIPAAGGVDSTALIVSDFSNGNDGVVIKGEGKKVTDLKGMDVNLVELSVSHYLLARALDSVGLTEKDLKVVNTSDADISAAFNTEQVKAITTWNPMLSDIKAQPGVSEVFNSSQIPGEIMDMMVVNTQTLQDNPALGKALTGAWFEVVALMNAKNAASKAALEHMAKASGTDLAGFQAQLDTTRLFATPQEALGFATSGQLPDTQRKVADFSFRHGLLGEGAKNADAVGMAFANGVILGDKANLKLRFDPTYVQLAADAKL
ncbi:MULTISPECIES: putative urea ABC transporter substrate-binding protein [unclassified Pseudomonas]|uniref:putative urea ABC transporter substrate-binding protein n=1 Tax=unclassified Pseudomonas TaxID=196821 RepID=UPI00087698CD|nr:MULTISPECIES: putative urea ABC transporter substrate-binding protein [unclassified Pseudomonas]ROO35122.1 lipid kinase [Pseudomonas sp. 7SR1]SCX70486.1 NitT/TauT family transport system substrate-binding protein [Pseudomonas sp. NFACC32-1]SFY09218.1 NitT/TauT family transport system substrate-binding protein [Pseudomonas sp. NFACC47-1]SFY20572.1 NitT/TauT family transport system substrate-binding protein [Pseudomonas sp. NFACC36]SFY35234.1 NitT/TauT family transport system substrate-bindin